MKSYEHSFNSLTNSAETLGLSPQSSFLEYFSRRSQQKNRRWTTASLDSLATSYSSQGSCTTAVSDYQFLGDQIQTAVTHPVNIKPEKLELARSIPRHLSENLFSALDMNLVDYGKDQEVNAVLQMLFFLRQSNVEVVATAKTPDIMQSYNLLLDLMLYHATVYSNDASGIYSLMLHQTGSHAFPVLNYTDEYYRKSSLLIFPSQFEDKHNKATSGRALQIKPIIYRLDGSPGFERSFDYFSNSDELMLKNLNLWDWRFFFSRTLRSEAVTRHHATNVYSFLAHRPPEDPDNNPDGSRVAAVLANNIVTRKYSPSLFAQLPRWGLSTYPNNPDEIKKMLERVENLVFDKPRVRLLSRDWLVSAISACLPVPFEQFVKLKFPVHTIERADLVGSNYLASPTSLDRHAKARAALTQIMIQEQEGENNQRRLRQMGDEVLSIDKHSAEYQSRYIRQH